MSVRVECGNSGGVQWRIQRLDADGRSMADGYGTSIAQAAVNVEFALRLRDHKDYTPRGDSFSAAQIAEISRKLANLHQSRP